MKIKKFNQLNESVTSAENEKIALKNGFAVGDTVYNKIMSKYNKIVLTAPETRGADNLCTLAAVGETPNNFLKADEQDSPNVIKVSDNPIGDDKATWLKDRELSNIVSRIKTGMRKTGLTFDEIVEHVSKNI